MKRNRRPPSPLLQLGFLLFYAGCAAGHLSLLSGAACSFLCGAGAGLGLTALFLRSPLSRPLRAWKNSLLRRS